MNFSLLKFSKLSKCDYFVLMFIKCQFVLAQKSPAVNPFFFLACVSKLPVSEVIAIESRDIAYPGCL